MRVKLERSVEVGAAYDKRNPDPSKNYGIHGVSLRFLLRGPNGVVQFVIYTNWQLPHVRREFDAKASNHNHFLCHPQPADIGYHSYVPTYEGQTSMGSSCEYLGGVECFYDGSTLYADDVFKIMVEKGGEAMWAELEAYYEDRLAGLVVPAPVKEAK